MSGIPRSIHRAIHLTAIVVAVAALRTGRDLLVPVALAFLMVLTLDPIVRAIERLRIRRTAAVFLPVLIAFGLIGVFGWIVSREISEVGSSLPKYRGNVESKAAALGPAGSLFVKGYDSLEAIGKDLAHSGKPGAPGAAPDSGEAPRAGARPSSTEMIGVISFSLFEFAGNGLIVLLLVIFVLIYRDDLRDRMVQLFGRGSVNTTTQTIEDAIGRVSRYLLSQALVNAGYGVIIWLGLLAIGIPSAFLWGILAGVLRFIPYFGTPLGAVPPLALSVAVLPDWSGTMLLAGAWLAFDNLVAYALEPLLYGKRTGISPFAVLPGAVFWTWAWGAPGLLLSIPLTVALVVVGRHIPQLGFLNTLLGEEVLLEPRIQLYYRILARDRAAAEEIIDAVPENMPLGEVADHLILPTFSLLQQDHDRGRLDKETLESIAMNASGAIEYLADRASAPSAAGQESPASPAPAGAPDSYVLAVPVASSLDEVGALALIRILGSRGVRMETLKASDSSEEKALAARNRKPELVMIVAVHPAGIIPVRNLWRTVRSALPGTEVMVALLSAPQARRDWSEKIAAHGGGPLVVTSVRDAERAVMQLLSPIAAPKESASGPPLISALVADAKRP